LRANSLFDLVDRRTGHFRLESGHHTDSWLSLDQLFTRPAELRPHLRRLAERIDGYGVEVICGPLTGGAFLAQLIATELNVGFSFAERIPTGRAGMYPVDYRVPPALRPGMTGKRVAIVDDAISAGSAVASTLRDLRSADASVAVLAALITIGERPAELARANGLPLESLIELAAVIWDPAECPMCRAAAPIQPLS
jgi:orotate phosphoribosyltransferase